MGEKTILLIKRLHETSIRFFDSVWLPLYAFGIILFPPIRFGSKQIFFAEILLAPLLIRFALRILQRRVERPQKELVLTWCLLTVAFVSGFWRGEIAKELSLYLTYFYPTEGDHFHWGVDGIRFIRWVLLFSTPWIVSQTLESPKPAHFLKPLKIAVSLSAGLAFLGRAGILNLAAIYGYKVNNIWVTRSFGTFQSPLEASLVYGGALVLIISEFFLQQKKPSALDIAAAVTLAAVLFLTGGGTALVGLFCCLLILILNNQKRRMGFLLVGSVFCIALIFLIPHEFFARKGFNFLYRFQLYERWFNLVQHHVNLVFTGIGFTGLISDSSFFLMLLFGGIGLLAAVLCWTRKLFLKVPLTIRPFYIFWFISWLALDSIGFWGIGRIGWLLFGICLASKP